MRNLRAWAVLCVIAVAPGCWSTELDTGQRVESLTRQVEVAGGRCASAHRFERAGMYSVQIVVEDDDGGMSERVEHMLIVESHTRGAVRGAGVLRDFEQGGDNPYVAGYVSFAGTNKGLFVPPLSATALKLIAADDSRYTLHTLETDWLLVPSSSGFVLKAHGVQHEGRDRSTVNVLLYGWDGCDPPPLRACDPHADRMRIVLWAGDQPTPTVENVTYDSQPGTSFDIDRFKPSLRMDPGFVLTWPY